MQVLHCAAKKDENELWVFKKRLEIRGRKPCWSRYRYLKAKK
jgi:hypothetical protein